MRFTTIAFILLLLGWVQYTVEAQTGEAQTEPPTLNFETLTLDQAIAFALKHAPLIQEAELTVALAELDLKRTQLWKRLIPSLTLHHGYNPIVGESRVGIGLSLDFNRIWEEDDKAKGAKLKWFNASVYRKTVQNRVILSVTQSYYDWVVAQKQVELLLDQLSTQLKLQELQKLQFESGQAQLNSVLNTLDATATTQLALIKAQASVQLQELKLKNDIGWDNVREEKN